MSKTSKLTIHDIFSHYREHGSYPDEYLTYKLLFDDKGSFQTVINDKGTANVYTPQLFWMLTQEANHLMDDYIDGFKNGKEFFKENFWINLVKLSNDEEKAEYFHSLESYYKHPTKIGSNGWSIIMKEVPRLAADQFKDWGYYAGLIAEMYDLLQGNLNLFKKLRLNFEVDEDNNLINSIDKRKKFLEKKENQKTPELNDLQAQPIAKQKEITFKQNEKIDLELKGDVPKEDPKPFEERIVEIKSKENKFWKGIPMDVVIDHFIVMTRRKGKNQKPYLSESQFIKFLETGFLNEGDKKQKINCPSTKKGFVIKRFHDFYTLANTEYSHPTKTQPFIDLFNKCFDNWKPESIKDLFKPNKTKETW